MNDAHPLDWYPEPGDGDERTDSLALIDRARAALAAAETLADIGAVMDVAERARRYSKAARLGIEAENHAAWLWLDAAREAGKWLAEREKHPPGPEPGDRSQNGTYLPPSLADLAVTKRQSSDWQALARLSDAAYRKHVDRMRAAQRPLRLGGLVEEERKDARTKRRAEAKPLATLTRGDVRLEPADITRRLPLDDETVDLIVTSPPYGLDVEYTGGDVEASGWPAFMEDALRELWRVAKHAGRLALNIPLDTSEPTYRPTYMQAVHAALDAGWRYRTTIVWSEGNTTKGGWALGSQSSAARPHHVSQVEMIPLFFKGEWAPSSDGADDITSDEFLKAGRGPWEFSGESRPWEDHPAPFPLELPRRLIPYLCRVGDVVLDPFCGSGTTLVAAVERGREAIGFDISAAYVESARRRLSGAFSEVSDV